MPKRVLEGRVVSAKMEKTCVVQVERTFMHPQLHKPVRKTKRYHAHDEFNQGREGDRVAIQECAPRSKLKRFEIVSFAERSDKVILARNSRIGVSNIPQALLPEQPHHRPKSNGRPARLGGIMDDDRAPEVIARELSDLALVYFQDKFDGGIAPARSAAKRAIKHLTSLLASPDADRQQSAARHLSKVVQALAKSRVAARDELVNFTSLCRWIQVATLVSIESERIEGKQSVALTVRIADRWSPSAGQAKPQGLAELVMPGYGAPAHLELFVENDPESEPASVLDMNLPSSGYVFSKSCEVAIVGPTRPHWPVATVYVDRRLACEHRINGTKAKGRHHAYNVDA